MKAAIQNDVSSKLLYRMKEGGFDFSRFHVIEFYALFQDEHSARQAASQFQGESLNTQVSKGENDAWVLQVCKVMVATYEGIGDFEEVLDRIASPLGGRLDGWGVTAKVNPDVIN